MQYFCLISRANTVWNRWNRESAGRAYFNISREKPAHTPETPHVQPLSCKIEWTNQKHF